MPLDRSVTPEAFAFPESYGLSELGPDHRSLDDVYAEIAAARTWWVATVSRSGAPHSVPVWGVIADDRMIFASDPSSVKSQNLALSSRLVVHLESGDDVVIVEADSNVIEADALPDAFFDLYEAKYDFRPNPAEGPFRAHEVLPTKIMTWNEAHFAETAARWRFR